MKVDLCVHTLQNVLNDYSSLEGELIISIGEHGIPARSTGRLSGNTISPQRMNSADEGRIIRGTHLEIDFQLLE